MKQKSSKRGRGRPAHQPTAVSRRSVSIKAGGGMLHEQIAMAMGISTDTLRRHYEHELSVGASMRRGNVLEAMYKAATTKGSTAAAKVYLANEPELAVPPMAKETPAPTPEPVAPVAPAQKLGKKEQAAADAVTAAEGTGWNDLLPRPGIPLQ